MGKKPFAFALAVLALTLSLSIVSFGQGTTSRITGTVTDNNGGVVSGATITLTNEGTKTSQSTQTSDSGTYTFDLIQPGTYTVICAVPGHEQLGMKVTITVQ